MSEANMIYLDENEHTRLMALMLSRPELEYPKTWAPRALFERYETELPTYEDALEVIAAHMSASK